jgi:transcriptional regulator with XRE-family HTH domain
MMSKKELDLLRVGLEIYMGQGDYTLDDIAAQIGRDRMTIHRFLKGSITPRPQTLYKIRQLTTKIKIENRP